MGFNLFVQGKRVKEFPKEIFFLDSSYIKKLFWV